MTVIDSTQAKAVFAVIDAYDHPHGGRILRLRLRRGEAPAIKELKSGTLVAGTGDGPETRIQVDGFALFGGRVSDARLARTGRVDVHVRDEAARDVATGWSLRLPS
ncbi:MAG: hypothetical protein OXK77_07045 [Gemmatimonadota bacterium]|nr:hypothetical protein [Gemmatimonadota bacterium]MDE2864569.1 hypothetical protein [Gemmatimonadota bacterium]MYG22009.1 hypothetical protein [Gemmatimonadota bacterium]MYJ37362.1 hypothetical protein [Gemmatimonadota bacterium]